MTLGSKQQFHVIHWCSSRKDIDDLGKLKFPWINLTTLPWDSSISQNFWHRFCVKFAYASSVGYHCDSVPASRQFMRKSINEANAPAAWKFKNNKPTDWLLFPIASCCDETAGSCFIQFSFKMRYILARAKFILKCSLLSSELLRWL